VNNRHSILAQLICVAVFCLASTAKPSQVIPDPFLPDTVMIDNAASFATGTVMVPVSFTNDEDLAGIEITLVWNSLEVVLDSVSFIGSRVDYVGLKGAIIDTTNSTVIIHSIPFSQPDIPPGSGLFGRLYFSYPINIASQTVIIDSLTIIDGLIVHSNFFSDASAGQFLPQFRSGSIIFTDPSCCIGIRGNYDNGADGKIDIADLTNLIKFIFQGGAAPVCPFEGNINGDASETIDISDLTYLIKYIFQGGPPPPACP